jgi:hypothetical protein
MRSFAVERGYECHTACILFKVGAIKTLRSWEVALKDAISRR